MDITIEEHIKNLGIHSSTRAHELILECLEYHHLNRTSDLTVEMVEEFWKYKHGGHPEWRERMLGSFMKDSYA